MGESRIHYKPELVSDKMDPPHPPSSPPPKKKFTKLQIIVYAFTFFIRKALMLNVCKGLTGPGLWTMRKKLLFFFRRHERTYETCLYRGRYTA